MVNTIFLTLFFSIPLRNRRDVQKLKPISLSIHSGENPWHVWFVLVIRITAMVGIKPPIAFISIEMHDFSIAWTISVEKYFGVWWLIEHFHFSNARCVGLSFCIKFQREFKWVHKVPSENTFHSSRNFMWCLPFLTRCIPYGGLRWKYSDVWNWYKADTSNWNAIPNGDDASMMIQQTGGFCAYGIDGIFRGAILILFAFIAFDAMIMSPTFEYAWILPASTYSQSFIASNYPQSINRSIIAINTTIFICLLGMAFALTTIQPVYLMVCFCFYLSVFTFFQKI